jgi:Ice-binding-like
MKLSRRFSGRLAVTALIAALCGCHDPGTCPPYFGPAGPAPALGAAAAFGAFAAATLTNTGPSIVNADVGLTPGSSVTGFPPGIINGTLHINDAVAAQAKLDAQAAYNDLAGRPCNTTSPNLNGTLAPGVYCFPASASLTTTLVLDGQGSANAVFVFQIPTTLITATNSSVQLINGASAKNVFWQVGTSATLGTNTAFQGTIIANTSVTLNTGASIVKGRAMALNAAVTLDTNVITTP